MKKMILLIFILTITIGCNSNYNTKKNYTQNELIDIHERCEFSDYLFNVTGDLSYVRAVICYNLDVSHKLGKPLYYVYGDCDYALNWLIKTKYPYLGLINCK